MSEVDPFRADVMSALASYSSVVDMLALLFALALGAVTFRALA